MIKYNENTINDWYFADDNIIKVYRNNAVCYYKLTGGGDVPTAQTPCFAVVDDISQYQETEFEDVYDNATEKWYKLNNLNQYEEYGVYGSGRTITTYEGKLTVDGDYEYIYSGNSWQNVGEVSGGTITIKSPEYIEKDSSHGGRINLDYVWKTNSKMQFKFYSTNNGGGSMIGEEGMPDNNDCRMFFASTTAYFDWGSKRVSWSSNGRTNTLYEYEYGNRYIKNMVTSASKTGSTISTSRTNPLYLGLGGTDRFRTYYLKFYDGDTLVKDFIPWTDMNGNYGLFDKVSLSVYNVVSGYGSLTGSSNVTDVEVGGGYEYPLEYVVREDPPDNLVFSSMEEAEAYECPWVGMHATIAGDKYVFSGDSQSGYEWVEVVLPYDAEIQYLQSSGTQYINTGAYLNTSNFEVGYETADAYCLWGYCHQNVGNGTWLGLECTTSQNTAFFGRFGSSYMTNISSYMTSGNNTIVYKQNGLTVNGNTISKNLTMGTDNIANIPLTFFARYDFYKGGMEWQNDSKFKSFYLKNNDEYVVDMIPVRVGQIGYMYDKISGQLFGNAGTGNFILGADK